MSARINQPKLKKSGNGFGTRYDPWSANTANDFRTKTHDAPPVFNTNRLLMCFACKKKKPIAGGKRIGGWTSKKFQCADCTKAKKLASTSTGE